MGMDPLEVATFNLFVLLQLLLYLFSSLFQIFVLLIGHEWVPEIISIDKVVIFKRPFQ